MEQADLLTYKNQNVNCRTVTLSGDDFNPRGVLTGGSRNQKASVLQALHDVFDKYERISEINQQQNSLRGVLLNNFFNIILISKAKLSALLPLRQRFDDLNTLLQDQKHHLDAAKAALKFNPVEVLNEEIACLEMKVKDAKEQIEKNLPDIDKLKQRVVELERLKMDENFQALNFDFLTKFYAVMQFRSEAPIGMALRHFYRQYPIFGSKFSFFSYFSFFLIEVRENKIDKEH
jgi:chromosome segregation ATPase